MANLISQNTVITSSLKYSFLNLYTAKNAFGSPEKLTLGGGYCLILVSAICLVVS